MRNRTKLLLTALTAALALAAMVSTASARRLSISEDDFEAIWAALTFETDSNNSVACPVTLLGSFHSRTIAKTAYLIGHITHARVRGNQGAGACTNGTATVLTADLPWHLTYNGFNGLLPNLSGVRLLLVGARFRVDTEGIACLAGTTTTEPGGGTANLNTATGQITSLAADPSFPIDLPGFFCSFAGDASFAGNASVTTLTGALIFIDLI